MTAAVMRELCQTVQEKAGNNMADGRLLIDDKPVGIQYQNIESGYCKKTAGFLASNYHLDDDYNARIATGFVADKPAADLTDAEIERLVNYCNKR